MDNPEKAPREYPDWSVEAGILQDLADHDPGYRYAREYQRWYNSDSSGSDSPGYSALANNNPYKDVVWGR